jgi:hypothetical protein
MVNPESLIANQHSFRKREMRNEGKKIIKKISDRVLEGIGRGW